jgi:hypothetical protein
MIYDNVSVLGKQKKEKSTESNSLEQILEFIIKIS